MRRQCETVKLLLSIVGGVVFIYGFYTYNALYARCRRTEDSNDKLQQLHESLSSQLQIINEHKSRLEKTVQQEKLTHSKDRDEWEFDRDELIAKQKQLAGRLDSVNRDLGLLQSRYEELESDYNKLQDEHHKLTEDHRLLAEQHDDKYQQYKVDCENQVTNLKDQVSAQKRRVELCQAELNANNRHPPAAPQPVAPQQRHETGDIGKVAKDIQRAGDVHMPALDRSALGVGDNKPQANIPAYNVPKAEKVGPAVRPVRERKKSAVKASAVKMQEALPLGNRGDEDGSVKLHRAGVVAQNADFDNGRQQAAAPRVDSVAGGGVVRGDSHIADKRIGDSEPEVNARPFAKNDQLMANGGRMGRLNSAAGRDVAAGGQGHHAGEEKDGDDGAVKDARNEHDDSLRPIGQQDGGDEGDNRDDLDDNQLAAAVAKPPSLNHPPAALRDQDDPLWNKNNKDNKAQYDDDYHDEDNKDQ